MTSLHLVIPERAAISLDELRQRIEASRVQGYEPFAPELLHLVAAFSTRLFSSPKVKRFPELQALAFFMRRARLIELQRDFERGADPFLMRTPRGTVFQIPPTNVSSILIYTWLMATLTGNVSIIRLPSAISPELQTILDVWHELTASERFLPELSFVVQYGHDDELTAGLSATADVRVIWGGDDTVNALRRFPLQPSATELAFPDKFSLAVLSASAYSAAGPQERDRLVAKFYNDTFWFDQAACSSPRLLVWIGSASLARESSGDFLQRLAGYIPLKNRPASTGIAIQKEAFACAAIIDQDVVNYRRYGNELTVLDLETLEKFDRSHCGGGLLFQHFGEDWTSLFGFLSRKDQTVSYFGFSAQQIRDVVRRLNGRGVDRFVPIGQALDFHPVWDGYHLLHELSRTVSITPEH